jgi:hypothetical protein
MVNYNTLAIVLEVVRPINLSFILGRCISTNMLFEAHYIVQVDKDSRDVDYRVGRVEPYPSDHDHSNSLDNLTVTGLHDNDFGLFVGAGDLDLGMTEISYFVTQHSKNISTIVNSDKVLENPNSYVTPHLADLLKSAKPGEIEQFGIDAIMNHIYRTFGR